MVEKAQLKYYPYDGGDLYQARANEWKEKLGINRQFEQVREQALKKTKNNDQEKEKLHNFDMISISNNDMFNSKHKPVQFTRQVDPNAVQNAMEIALKRYEQNLADKKNRRKQELDNIDKAVENEKAKE